MQPLNASVNTQMPPNQSLETSESTILTYKKIATKLYILVTSKILINLLFSEQLDQDLASHTDFIQNNLQKLLKVIELFPNFKNFSKFYGGNIKLMKQNRNDGSKILVDKYIMPRVFLSDVVNLVYAGQKTSEAGQDEVSNLQYFSSLCEELLAEKSLIYNLLKLCILSLYLDKTSKLLNRLNFKHPSISLPICYQYLELLYKIRKIFFINLDKKFPNFTKHSQFASDFHAKVDKISQKENEKLYQFSGGQATMGSQSGKNGPQNQNQNQGQNQVHSTLFWQKNVQNFETCPFIDEGMLSFYGRKIWLHLISNEVCREFIIYFLYKQEDYSEQNAVHESVGNENQIPNGEKTQIGKIKNNSLNSGKNSKSSSPNLIRKNENFEENMKSALV